MSGERKWSRRDFLKTAGAAGVGSMLLPAISSADVSDKTLEQMVVPTRPFGKTGVNVSMLSLGGGFNTQANQRLMRQAFKLGVTYWDTAEAYGRGWCEGGYGKYFSKYPKDRKKVFLVTKTISREPDLMTSALEGSLKRMGTSYVDLYLWHKISLFETYYDNKVRNWVEKMKSEGKIRFFGFSTHTGMEDCMIEAAKLGGIDGIMMSYNFRIMNTDLMKEAVDACVNAGIGLTAMKTAGFHPGAQTTLSPAPPLEEEEKKLLSDLSGQFLKKGFDDIQARLMAVWQNPQIASICSQMPNMKILKSNVDAANNYRKLSQKDMKSLEHYARETSSGYCAGCASICETAVSGHVPIADVMRYLMYCNGYGDRDRASSLFKGLPVDTRNRIVSTDYRIAESRCPQRMPIGRLMKEAASVLS